MEQFLDRRAYIENIVSQEYQQIKSWRTYDISHLNLLFNVFLEGTQGAFVVPSLKNSNTIV